MNRWIHRFMYDSSRTMTSQPHTSARYTPTRKGNITSMYDDETQNNSEQPSRDPFRTHAQLNPNHPSRYFPK